MANKGFTIKCNNCGTERVFTDKSKKYNGESIAVDVAYTHSYGGIEIESIDFDCNNIKCNAVTEVNY